MQRTQEPQQLRLFVFHHAGGSHLAYRDWPSRFPSGWQVRIPDAPGRGPRDTRPALRDADALVEHYLHALEGELTGRFVFFGHSLGAMAAYQLTRRLIETGRTAPRWLGISAHNPLPRGGTTRPAGRDTTTTARPADVEDAAGIAGATGVEGGAGVEDRAGGAGGGLCPLPDAELRRALAAMGGTPPEVLDHPQLWELFAPVIRADLRIDATWRPGPPDAPLPVPLSVFGGSRDQVAPPRLLGGWAGAAEPFLGMRVFDGGHFYFQDRLPEVARHIQDEVRRALRHRRAPSAVTR